MIRPLALALTFAMTVCLGAAVLDAAPPAWDDQINNSKRFRILQEFHSEAVLDRETGLVWERSPDLGTDTWSGAYGHCLVWVIGERRGWRLPAFEELLTLVVGPMGGAGLPPGHPFENIGAAYWTATTQLDNPTPTALIVAFEPFFFTAGGEKSNTRSRARTRARRIPRAIAPPGAAGRSACPSRGRRAGRSLRAPDAPRRPLPGGRGRRYSLGASGQAEAGDAGPGRRRESIASVSYVLSQAVRLLERAEAQCREWNITTHAPIVMAALGHMYAWSGRIGQGVACLQQAQTAYESAGIGFHHSLSVEQLGEAYLLADQIENARACAERAVTLARGRGERGYEAWALRLLGDIAAHHARPDGATAAAHYGAALTLAAELEMRPLVAHCHLGLGRLYRRTGRHDRPKST